MSFKYSHQNRVMICLPMPPGKIKMLLLLISVRQALQMRYIDILRHL